MNEPEVQMIGPMLYGGTMQSIVRMRQSGVAAVELAILLPLMISLLAVPLYFARLFMHYSVMYKAAENAGIYFATIPKLEMADPIWAVAAEEVAEEIVASTVAELKPGGRNQVRTEIYCDGEPCGVTVPTNIRVVVKARITDDFFSPFTWLFRGGEGIVLTTGTTVPYLGD